MGYIHKNVYHAYIHRFLVIENTLNKHQGIFMIYIITEVYHCCKTA